MNNQITFCFPESEMRSKKEFIDSIIDCVSFDSFFKYAGYQSRASLRKNISWRFEDSLIKKYKSISPINKKRIESLINQTLKESFAVLPSKTPVHIFVFPALEPFDNIDKIMGYVSGFTTSQNVIHVFISPENFLPVSLRQTIAHEFNHLIFFQNHPYLHPEYKSNISTVKDVLVWEGLAENFSFLVTGKKAPATKILSMKKAREVLKDLNPDINKKINGRDRVYESLFFGTDGKYEFWTGYSLGFLLVQLFLNRNKIKWNKIMTLSPEEIFQKSFIKLKNL
jgi:uncharacterized protein YjaZ